MGLERRGNGYYYYQKERHGDQVVSRYFGSGEIGMLAMQLDRLKRQEAEDERWELNRQRREHEETEQQVIAIERQIREQLAEVLRANGYYQHKGQWRKQREHKTGR